MGEPKKPKTVRRYQWADWEGILRDDEILQANPVCFILKRDGEIIVVSDDEVTVTI